MDLKRLGSDAGNLIIGSFMEAEEEKKIQFMNEGATKQRDNDICTAIMGFLDLKASDAQVYDLLQRYFEIDSISAAQVYVNKAKNELTVRRVMNYLKAQNNGNWNLDFGKYTLKLRHALEEDSKYQMKDPAKIVNALKKGE